MKRILVSASAVGVLLLLIAVIGAVLPKGHVATRMARFAHSPAAVWGAIAGPRDWSTDRTKTEVVESVEPRRLVTRIADPSLPYGGTWTQEIEPLPGGGVSVRITERGEIYNPIFRFLARFVFGYNGTMEKYLQELGKKFDESVSVEG